MILSPENKVSIRTCSSESYSQIDIAQDGSDYEWVATSDNGWYAVALENQVDWVFGGFG